MFMFNGLCRSSSGSNDKTLIVLTKSTYTQNQAGRGELVCCPAFAVTAVTRMKACFLREEGPLLQRIVADRVAASGIGIPGTCQHHLLAAWTAPASGAVLSSHCAHDASYQTLDFPWAGRRACHWSQGGGGGKCMMGTQPFFTANSEPPRQGVAARGGCL